MLHGDVSKATSSYTTAHTYTSTIGKEKGKNQSQNWMLSLCLCVHMCLPPLSTCLMATGVSAWLSPGDLSLYVRTSCHAEAETTLPRVDRSPPRSSTPLPCLRHKGNAPAWKCGSDTKPAGNQMSPRRVVELMLPLPLVSPSGYRCENYACKCFYILSVMLGQYYTFCVYIHVHERHALLHHKY